MVFLLMWSAGSFLASHPELGDGVRLGTHSICGTHLTNRGLIILGQSTIARCSKPTASQVNNVGSEIHEVFFMEPAITSHPIILYSLTSIQSTSFCLNRRKVLRD
jgi:hypothetical protein